MSKPPDLELAAKKFAAETSELLNGTVANGIRLNVLSRGRGAVVGYQLGREYPIGRPIPLTMTKAPARLFLYVLHTLQMDPEGTYLADSKSTYSLQVGETPGETFASWDYTREPANEYPAAHLHLYDTSGSTRTLLDSAGRDKDSAADLHLPVGGKRYRPCLEDVIEFCILEKLVDFRDSWQKTLTKHRSMYLDRQLRAAARRGQVAVAEVLEEAGWSVTPPEG